MNRAIGASAICAILLAGCVDMTAVGNYAKESSAIASNKGALDASDAESQVILLAGEAGLSHDKIEDPGAATFKAQQAVTTAALAALAKYMDTLAALSSKSTTALGADISSISGSLANLDVAGSKTKSALSATQALVNLFTSDTVKYTTRTLILAAAKPVGEITGYLADQAQTAANTYDEAAHLSDDAWVEIMSQTGPDKSGCTGSNLCKLVYRLGHRASAEDRAAFMARAASALQAKAAFQKIHKDHDLLVSNIDHLTAKAVVAELKADEPDLQNAIKGLKGA